MTIFDELSKRELKCDICGGVMLPLPGGGWDNDRIVCGDRLNCGAEIEFPTSTAVDWPETESELRKRAGRKFYNDIQPWCEMSDDEREGFRV